MRKNILRNVGWLVSIALILIFFYFFDFKKIFHLLNGVILWYLPILFVIYAVDFTLRAYRWKLLLYPVKKSVKFNKLFYSYNIAYFANIFLPARLGELFRVAITSKEEGVSKRSILGTLFLERVLDVLGIGVVIVLSYFFISDKIADKTYLNVLILWTAIFICLFFAVFLIVFFINKFTFIKIKSEKLIKIIDILKPFYHGLSSFHDIQALLALSVLSVLMWVLNAFILYLYILSLSLNIGFFDSLVILLFQLLGEFIPSAPSSIGTYHASTVLGGKIVGLNTDLGLSVAILSHFYDIFLRVVFGLISIRLLKFDFKRELKKLKLL